MHTAGTGAILYNVRGQSGVWRRSGVGLFGIGTFTQINGITSAVQNFFDADQSWAVELFGRSYSWSVVISGLLLTLCVALVLIGGLKRISSVAQVVIPFMAIIYVAAAAKTDQPAKQGLISMMGTLIDTIIICTMTGLTIVITGAYDMGLDGVAVTTKAFQLGLPFSSKVASFILMACLVFFAFTTILGWDYYSERCLEYLTGHKQKIVKAYRWVYILCVFVGPYMTVKAVWTIADIFNGLMAIPNLIALLALNGVVVAETKIYLDGVKKKNY